MAVLVLGLVSFVAWFLSMLAGGGSPLVLMPLISLLFGVQAVAPAITTGLIVGNAQRSLFFRESINWTVTLWYVPGAIVGAILGAYWLNYLHADWLQIVLGMSLLLMVIHYLLSQQLLSQQEQTFLVKAWYFLPLAFLNAIASALIGSTGPILNPIYLNYGLEKEALIATKSLNKTVLHIIKILAYGTLGSLDYRYLAYGLVIGLAAIPANWLGKKLLQNVSNEQFRHLVFGFVAISGVFMLWEQRQSLLFWAAIL